MTRGQTLDASLIAEIASKAPKLSRTDREAWSCFAKVESTY